MESHLTVVELVRLTDACRAAQVSPLLIWLLVRWTSSAAALLQLLEHRDGAVLTTMGTGDK